MTNERPDFYWLNEDSIKFLKKDYLEPNQTPIGRVEQIAQRAEDLLKIEGFAAKFKHYMARGYYSLSSPVWSNYGLKRGLPCSCNCSYISDSIESIISKLAEISVMTKHGSGTSAFFGDIRPRGAKISTGGESQGPMHFMQLFDTATKVISQSSIRRGALAAYLPIEHPDIKEFLQIRELGNPIQDLSIGVCVSDDFIKGVIAGDLDKQEIWKLVLKKRFASGYPYIFFTDTVNNNKPQVYKDKGMKIHSSQLCSEVILPTSNEESFVCVLSSINVLHWDEIKKTDAIETLLYFLDSVNEEYIEKTVNIKFLECAHRFAKNHRALGLGVLGWHSFLQNNMIPFESMQAKFKNVEIFKTIEERCLKANKEMAVKYGEPDLLKGYGLRNTTCITLAPTTSSAFVLGQVSQSIEPFDSNYFVNETAKGKFTFFNPYLEKLLIAKKKNNTKVRHSILSKGGSVQHLDFLSQEEKDVFKTFQEISQKEIIIQAAARQKYIDQSQSLNLKIHKDIPLKDVNQLVLFAWEQGVKTLYYQRGVNAAQELSRSILECTSCSA